MNTLRTIVFGTIAAVVMMAAFIFTASLGLAIAGILSVLMIGSAVAQRLAPRPVRARTDTRKREPRIWNDGRGTIIDL